ncbi:hypothetical protein DAI22_07g152550 [Oryza sativa Japonica Group]|nr:hypothetical protein DAI22_07g152550 [Oryza sativa Japonica Group]
MKRSGNIESLFRKHEAMKIAASSCSSNGFIGLPEEKSLATPIQRVLD